MKTLDRSKLRGLAAGPKSHRCNPGTAPKTADHRGTGLPACSQGRCCSPAAAANADATGSPQHASRLILNRMPLPRRPVAVPASPTITHRTRRQPTHPRHDIATLGTPNSLRQLSSQLRILGSHPYLIHSGCLSHSRPPTNTASSTTATRNATHPPNQTQRPVAIA